MQDFSVCSIWCEYPAVHCSLFFLDNKRFFFSFFYAPLSGMMGGELRALLVPLGSMNPYTAVMYTGEGGFRGPLIKLAPLKRMYGWNFLYKSRKVFAPRCLGHAQQQTTGTKTTIFYYLIIVKLSVILILRLKCIVLNKI